MENMTTINYGALNIETINLRSRKTFTDVIKSFSHVGFISFGGTAANIGLFRSILVEEDYLTQEEFTEMFSLAQCLPGPSAAQILLNGVITGTGKVYLGILAFIFFTLPAVLLMSFFGYLVHTHTEQINGDTFNSPLLKAIQEFIGLAAISVICINAYQITCKLVVDRTTKLIFTLTCIMMLAFSDIWWLTPLCLLFGGFLTFYEGNGEERTIENDNINHPVVSEVTNVNDDDDENNTSLETKVGISYTSGIILLIIPWILFFTFLLLETLILDKNSSIYHDILIVSIFLRVGILVYGGGPVVVPLLITQLVPINLLTQNQFLIGFSAVSIMPGPMFSLAAYCGAVIGGPLYALLCWAAMSLPGLSMSIGALPLWSRIREIPAVKQTLKGVNAAAAGLMTSAFIDLWLKLVDAGSDQSQTVMANVNTRASIVILFVGLQAVLKQSSARVIVIGLFAGFIVSFFL